MNEIVLHESSPQDDSRQYFHIDEMENSSRVKSYNLSGVCPEGFVESISDLNSTVFLSGSKSLHDMFEVRNALISIGFKIEKQGYLSHDHRIGFVHASKK
jgi:hypothetical protein